MHVSVMSRVTMRTSLPELWINMWISSVEKRSRTGEKLAPRLLRGGSDDSPLCARQAHHGDDVRMIAMGSPQNRKPASPQIVTASG